MFERVASTAPARAPWSDMAMLQSSCSTRRAWSALIVCECLVSTRPNAARTPAPLLRTSARSRDSASSAVTAAANCSVLAGSFMSLRRVNDTHGGVLALDLLHDGLVGAGQSATVLARVAEGRRKLGVCDARPCKSQPACRIRAADLTTVNSQTH